MQSETVTSSIIVHSLPSRNMYWEIIGMGDKGYESGIGEGTGIHRYYGKKGFENGFFPSLIGVILLQTPWDRMPLKSQEPGL